MARVFRVVGFAMPRDKPTPRVTSLTALVKALESDDVGMTVISMPPSLLNEAHLRGVLDASDEPRLRDSGTVLKGAPLVAELTLTILVAENPRSEPSEVAGGSVQLAATAPLLGLEYEGDKGRSRILLTRDAYPCEKFARPFFPGAAPLPDVEIVPGPWRWSLFQVWESDWTPTSHGGCFETFNDAIADALSMVKIERIVDFVTNDGERPVASNPVQLQFKFNMPSLYKRFAGKGAPVQGEKGFRAPPLDGRARAEIAKTAFENATRYLEDPEFFYLLDPDWLLEWGMWVDDSAYSDPDELRRNKEEFVSWLDLPSTDSKGRAVSLQAQSDFGHYVYALAKLVDGSAGMPGSPMSEMSSRAGSFETESYPAWAAMAELEDALKGPERSRLVFVPKRQAFEFIKKHHSHLGEGHRLPPGTMYSIGVKVGDRLVAVATAGHPTGAPMRRGPGGATPRSTLQLTRVASDGTTKNAASMLVGRILDILERSSRDPSAPSLFITYSLLGEPGTPYRALRDKGLRPVCITSAAAPSGARAGGDGLSRVPKIRWEAGPDAAPGNWEILTTGKGPKCKGLFR